MTYVGDLVREITALETRLEVLRRAAGSTSGERTATAPKVPSSTDTTRRRPGRPRKNREGTPDAERPSSKAATRKRTHRGRKRAFTVTPKVLASREVQGRYLPLLRRFTGAKRARYAKLAKTDGREAAISEMQNALKS